MSKQLLTLAFFPLYICALMSISVSTAEAQVTQEWVARYNNEANSNDIAEAIAIDGMGNVYVTGYCPNIGTSDDYTTIKYNSSGNIVWMARYNGPGNGYDWANTIAVDGIGNVYVTGYSQGIGTDADYATIKYNSSGDIIWMARYNGPGNREDWAWAIAVDGMGNVYVTGRSYGSGTSYDYATIKYNSSGVEQWVTRYNGPGNSIDRANTIAIDGSGNVYVTGESFGSGTSYDYATIKYNSSGVEQWVARYNGTGNLVDNATSIAVDGMGNVYVTGNSYGSGTSYDYATIKYNSSGIEQWVARYNGTGNHTDQAFAIAVDGLGNVYITGYSYGETIQIDFATIKYNAFGNTIWIRRYDGPEKNDDVAFSMAVDVMGNVYVTGKSWGGNENNYDYATVKYDSSGYQEWVARYNGPANSSDKPNAIAIDDSGNVYVTGESAGSGTNIDYVTIKYSQLQAPLAPSDLEAVADSTKRINLFWIDNSDYEEGFNIEKSSDGGSNWGLLASVGQDVNLYLDTGLIPYSVYHYRVYAFNSLGNSSYSNVANDTARSFNPDDNITVAVSDINSLINENVLNQGQGNGLITKLNAAAVKIEQVHYNAAIGLLNSFIIQVNGFINAEILTPEQGQPLINIAYDIINRLSEDSPLSVKKYSGEIPKEYALHNNFPNPFNPVTKIRFDIPKRLDTKITVYDILGRAIDVLLDNNLEPR